MVVIELTQDFEITATDGIKTIVFKIPSGTPFNSISYDYLPDHYKKEWPNQSTIEKDYYIIYIKGRFHRISKEHCDVPVCYRWGYNI